MSTQSLYPLVGLSVGLIVGLTGVGGGSLMTPILVFVFKVPIELAVGTDLLFASLTKIAGVTAHGARGNVDWHIVGTLAAGSLPSSWTTGCREPKSTGQPSTRSSLPCAPVRWTWSPA